MLNSSSTIFLKSMTKYNADSGLDTIIDGILISNFSLNYFINE